MFSAASDGRSSPEDEEEKFLKRDVEIERKEEDEQLKGPVFQPRLYKQRYILATDHVRKYGKKIRKVGIGIQLVDFGCSECRFLRRSRYAMPMVSYLVGVDIDGELLLETGVDELEPSEEEEGYFDVRRPKQLWAELYKGSVAVFDRRMADVDAATLIEVIEHLHQPILDKVPETIFGKYRPFLVVITTPNKEFNVLFEMPKNRRLPFRHEDHKFEWTRKQFQDWCLTIVERYPDYQVEFEGCGDPPEERKDVGFCSQVAIFTQRSWEKYTETIYPDKKELALTGSQNSEQEPYFKIKEIDFPFDKTARIAHRLQIALERACGRIFADSKIIEYPRDEFGRVVEQNPDAEDGLLPEEKGPERAEEKVVRDEVKIPVFAKDKRKETGEEVGEGKLCLSEKKVGYQLGVFIPLEKIMEVEEVKNLCDDSTEVGAFMATNGWNFRFEDEKFSAFYAVEDLPQTDEEDDDDDLFLQKADLSDGEELFEIY